MFPHDGQGAATDLSYWLGPLSPAFAAIAGSSGDTPSGSAPQATGGAAGEPLLGEPQTTETPAELRALFHALNNQLGVILTYAELLEAKAQDDGMRARAAQIVSATIEALGTSKKIRNSVTK
jgi:hypothetical protein